MTQDFVQWLSAHSFVFDMVSEEVPLNKRIQVRTRVRTLYTHAYAVEKPCLGNQRPRGSIMLLLGCSLHTREGMGGRKGT